MKLRRCSKVKVCDVKDSMEHGAWSIEKEKAGYLWILHAPAFGA